MRLELNQEMLGLRPRELLRIRGVAGHALVCHSGSVWLTQHGDGRDILLGAGERFVLDRDGVALLQAFEQSSVGLAPGAAARSVAARLRAAHTPNCAAA